MKRIGILFAMLLLATASYAQTPTAGGVVNAGSYAFAGLPNSPIAQGSLFVLFGTNMGPATLQGASFPLQATLGGTSINVTVSGTTVQALMIYTSAVQAAAVLPSRTPTGTGTLTVSYNGQSSATLPITVVTSNFGTLTWNSAGSGAAIVLDGNFNLITALAPAAPGQTIALWGTGLGPYSGDETKAPVQADMPNIPVEVYVGTAKANISYRGRTGFVGVDQINFAIPAGQLGCNVPVLVKIGSFVSNSATIAVSTGGPCSDPNGLSSSALQALNSKGSISIGSVEITRTSIQTPPISLPPGITLPPGVNLGGGTTTTETAGAGFERFTRDGFLASVGAGASSVSIGGCIVSSFRSGTAAASGVTGSFVGLDAGPSIGLNGPNGAKTLNKAPVVNGFYSAVLSTPPASPYIVPGSYTFTGTGGADVGAFTASLTVGPSLTWTNQSSITTVNRSQDLLITWSGAGNGTVEIIGTSTSGPTTAPFGGTFICFANASAGQFSVPAAVLLSLPVSNTISGGGVSIPTGSLEVGTFSLSNFTAPGIDLGVTVYLDVTGKSVGYQ